MNENKDYQEPDAVIPTTPASPSQATALTRQLIQIDNMDPGAYEDEIGRHTASQLTAMGVEVSTDQVLPGRFNVMGRIPGETDDSVLIYICHVDTVVVGDGRSVPPFSALECDGRTYDRGACDMKSGLTCVLSAFSEIAARAAVDQKPRYTSCFIATVDEEDSMRGVKAAIWAGWVTKGSWTLDTEPANGQIQVAHRGRTWFELTVTGVTAHASTPWKGADATASTAEIIVKIREQIAACPSHPEPGSFTVTFGQINGSYRPRVVPDSCTVCIDMRLVPPTDIRAAAAIAENVIRHGETAVPGTHGAYTIIGDRPYVEGDNNSYLLVQLADAYKTITASEADTTYLPGYADTAVTAGLLHNHSCMSYGPGDLELVHKSDESVPIEDILRCEQVLTALVNRILY